MLGRVCENFFIFAYNWQSNSGGGTFLGEPIPQLSNASIKITG
jgi:hypothetical protein